MAYVAGWIAHRMGNEDHGIKTSNEYWSWEKTESLAPWIFNISRGGAKVPYNDFMLDMENFEYEFIKFHGLHDLSRSPNIIRDFEEILIKKFGPTSEFEYSKKLLSLFARSRTFFRLRNLIQKLKDKKMEENAKNAEKRKQKAAIKFQLDVDKEIVKREYATKRSLDNSAVPFSSSEPIAKKPKQFKAYKDTRSYKQLGQLTTTNLK